jgi:hypothetical protein
MRMSIPRDTQDGRALSGDQRQCVLECRGPILLLCCGVPELLRAIAVDDFAVVVHLVKLAFGVFLVSAGDDDSLDELAATGPD